jgi:hypothetical protein
LMEKTSNGEHRTAGWVSSYILTFSMYTPIPTSPLPIHYGHMHTTYTDIHTHTPCSHMLHSYMSTHTYSHTHTHTHTQQRHILTVLTHTELAWGLSQDKTLILCYF